MNNQEQSDMTADALQQAEQIFISKGNREQAEAWLFNNSLWMGNCLHAGYARTPNISRQRHS